MSEKPRMEELEPLPDPLTMMEAERRGYVAVTTHYTRGEEMMLRAALRDMGPVEAVLVRVGGGVEIWRSKSQVKG